MGGAFKLLSLATALLTPIVQSLDVAEAQVVPGAYIVELAENKVSFNHQSSYSVPLANDNVPGTLYTVQQAR
jgi:hypothetical protein